MKKQSTRSKIYQNYSKYIYIFLKFFLFQNAIVISET